MIFHRNIALAAAALLAGAIAAPAQVRAPDPWRGAGPTPCVGSDGGTYQCPPAPLLVAIRAGRVFDSKSGAMLSNQIILTLR